MTEKDFLEIVALHVETYYDRPQKTKSVWEDYENTFKNLKRRAGKELKDINLDDCILIKWITGGTSGGSWRDNGGHYAVPGEKEPEFVDLDLILEKVCPKITYLEYRKLLYGLKPDLIEQDSWTEHEYYGNETIYGIKKIVLRRLWERLGGLGLV